MTIANRSAGNLCDETHVDRYTMRASPLTRRNHKPDTTGRHGDSVGWSIRSVRSRALRVTGSVRYTRCVWPQWRGHDTHADSRRESGWEIPPRVHAGSSAEPDACPQWTRPGGLAGKHPLTPCADAGMPKGTHSCLGMCST